MFLKRIHYQKKQIKWQIEELEQKKQEFEQVVSHMKEGLVLLNVDNQVLSINSAAKELFQATEDCIGNDFLTVERKQKLMHAIEKARTEGHGQIRMEKNNREYQFDVSSIQTEKGVVGSVILAFDITEQMNAEKMRREFSANVSHELKTPIALIQGYAEGLKDNVNEDPENREFYCDVIIDEASKMNKMVQKLLSLNQLEVGTAQPEIERFDIVPLVKSVLASVDILLQQKEVKLELNTDDSVYVWADEYMIEEVFTNFISKVIIG